MRARGVSGLEARAQLVVQLGECARTVGERLILDHAEARHEGARLSAGSLVV